ncbi:RF-1 domain-containing protein [Annulohypoxylon bovei var. microspora]|nr:RF-1 domain-containing protein [Annulohypoxylon bovei var. microspora]
MSPMLRSLRSVLAITSTSQRVPPTPTLLPRRFLSVSGSLLKHTNLPPRPKPPPEEEIEESFLKGSGPGGQKINKTCSAVQLKHLPTGLVIKSQATRSRSQNRTIARQLLADKLDALARGDQSRSAIVGEFKRKKKASSAKKSRRKYRKLEDDKARVAGEDETLEEEDEEEDGGFEAHLSDKEGPEVRK